MKSVSLWSQKRGKNDSMEIFPWMEPFYRSVEVEMWKRFKKFFPWDNKLWEISFNEIFCVI